MTEKQISNSFLKTYRASIWAKFIRAIDDYKLIKENDKIAICISGGKDSLIMARLFKELAKRWEVKFSYVFLMMDPGFGEEVLNNIKTNTEKLDIDLKVFKNNIFDYIEKDEKSPCYICARMRRGYLYREAKKLGCNKIALGHHFNDVIETTLMSMLYGSQIQTMVPKIKSKNVSGLELIRPLYYIKEKDIIRWTNFLDLKFIDRVCKALEHTKKTDSKRDEVKKLIAILEKTNPTIEANIFKSLQNVNIDMILGYKQGDIKKTFIEIYEEKNNE